MFAEKTCFVVGAGASCELGLPDGNMLKDKIKSALATTNEHIYVFEDTEMREAVRLLGAENENLREVQAGVKHAAEAILAGLDFAPSIDNFLHLHQDDEWIQKVGKAAIARCILEAEDKSYLFHAGSRGRKPRLSSQDRLRPGLEHPNLQKSWHTMLARIAFSQVKKENLPDALDRLRFVIFNYDRCLEQFLWSVLQALYSIDRDEAASLLKNVDFLHPYGSLGCLPWQDAQMALPLGTATAKLFEVGEGLRTFTESQDEGVADRGKTMLQRTYNAIFLGFGFLNQNVDLIRPAEPFADRILATAYGMAEPNRKVAVRMARSIMRYPMRENAYVLNATCRQLLDDHSLELTA